MGASSVFSCSLPFPSMAITTNPSPEPAGSFDHKLDSSVPGRNVILYAGVESVLSSLGGGNCPKATGIAGGARATLQEGKGCVGHVKSKATEKARRYVNHRRRGERRKGKRWNTSGMVEMEWRGGKWRTITGVADQLVPARATFSFSERRRGELHYSLSTRILPVTRQSCFEPCGESYSSLESALSGREIQVLGGLGASQTNGHALQ